MNIEQMDHEGNIYPRMLKGKRGYYYGIAVDENDKPVERTKYTHPYSYDGYVTWRGGDNKEITGTVYGDRLEQWDYDKCRQLAEKYGQHPNNMHEKDPGKIQAFLRDYMNEPKLKLILIMEYCNQSSGYPVWRYDYKIPKKKS